MTAEMHGQCVVFRVDASIEIGLGHAMRCMALANSLREMGAECRFICRPHAGHIINKIRQAGYRVDTLQNFSPEFQLETSSLGDPSHARWLGVDWSTDANQTMEAIGQEIVDWIVVDHYSLDKRWEERVRKLCRRLLVIDDLADREHCSDLLLDQNLYRSREDYDGLLPDNCKRLIGPNFALLASDFVKYRYKNKKSVFDKPRRILISFGGVDKDNVTGEVLDVIEACSLVGPNIVTVVLGSQAPWLVQVQEKVSQMSCSAELLVDVQDMAALLDDTDFAIGAAGVSALERCCMGVPTMLITIAENQREGAIALAASGAAILLGEISNFKTKLEKWLPHFINGMNFTQMIEQGTSICDGRGSERVSAMIAFLTDGHLSVRPANSSDASILFRWANDRVTRRNSIDSNSIEWDAHLSWLQRKLADPNRTMMLIGSLIAVESFGQVRFDKDADGKWVIDYSIGPQFRNLGLGKYLLNAALHFFSKSFPDVAVIGRVKSSNVPSVKVFDALGFQNLGVEGDLIVYRLVLPRKFKA